MKWTKWAVTEGLAKTASRLLQKFLGTSIPTIGGACLATLVIGVLMSVTGFIAARAHGRRLFAGGKSLLWSGLFGAIAVIMTVLSIYTFTFPGADVAVTTFLITLSIIPGAFIDWLVFGHPLKTRQWAGIGIFLVAGYFMLDRPTLSSLLYLPPWAGLSLLIAVLAAANESFTQAQAQDPAQVSPEVNNFWVGISTAICCGSALTILKGWELVASASALFWIGAVLIGVVTVVMIVAKLLAYVAGGTIAIKKLVMQGTFLATAAIFGCLFYREPFTSGKAIGILGYFVAFAITDQPTWQYLKGRTFASGR